MKFEAYVSDGLHKRCIYQGNSEVAAIKATNPALIALNLVGALGYVCVEGSEYYHVSEKWKTDSKVLGNGK